MVRSLPPIGLDSFSLREQWLVAMKRVRYFAYGSNLSIAQMRARCPSAVREAKATLPGYRLVFSGYSHGWNSPVASLVRDRRSVVPGLLYTLSADDLLVLDRFEGQSYERVSRLVTDRRGERRLFAHVYVMPDEPAEPCAPGVEYLCVLWLAYKRLGFNRKPLARAARLA